ncbi:MAG: hypothetical protein AMXMBFR84_17630 [Candidatus Hydrogenedentota bacterium]
MRRATDFMFGTLANRGGFVWLYSMDLEPFGELKARDSMIWVEPPGTPAVGLVLLEAYHATGDGYYLDRAKETAAPLAAGQHPSGGWNYFIDFDPDGLQRYYDEFFSKCWGWQEYLKRRGNATFDDYSTTEPTRFFLRLWKATGDTSHKAVLDKALDHILRAQLPSGGWPQRFPVESEDYTSCATFNDDVTADCIDVLLETHALTGEERYLRAARQGMDFYLVSQLPAPQAGWAQQYSADLKPAWGRPFEIAAVCSAETHSNVLELMDFYRITGDAKYLSPIPLALAWLEASVIPGAEGFTHTMFYELESNKPVYILQTGTTITDVKYTLTYDSTGVYPYGDRMSIPVEYLRGEFEKLRQQAPEAAKREYEEAKSRAPLPDAIRGGYLATTLAKVKQTPAGVAELCRTLDERGGWHDEARVMDPFSPFTAPAQTFDAYIVGGYTGRMYRLINYLNESASGDSE